MHSLLRVPTQSWTSPLHLEDLFTALALLRHALINDPSERERERHPGTGFRITMQISIAISKIMTPHFASADTKQSSRDDRLRVRVGWAMKGNSLRTGSRLTLIVSTDFNQNCNALGGWMAEAIQVCFGSRLDPTHRGLALALKSSIGSSLRPCK